MILLSITSITFSSFKSWRIRLTLFLVEIPQKPAISSLVTVKSIKIPSFLRMPKSSIKLWRQAQTAPFFYH